MRPTGIYDIIKVDEYSSTPKYQQIINCIVKGLESGKLNRGDALPSINDLSYELDVSRDTAERGYRYLKKIGLLNSVAGKGYFIKNAKLENVLRICIFFNKLSAHKKIIYDSFVHALGNNATIDFYIYNNDFGLFKKLLSSKNENYTHYVIIPHFIEGGENASAVINTLPKDKLVLLDKMITGVDGEYGAVYENFEEDIYYALQQAGERLSKYETLKIIFPANSYYPNEILTGFIKFCQDYAFNYKVVSTIKNEEIGKGEAYIAVMEDDLVKLVENIIRRKLQVGKDVGIISYNETPLKKIILNGITTISTDFNEMGKMTASLILEKSKKHLPVPFRLTLRDSL
ncbi:MAG TPA: GntR family transcriptional regulator [Puia sp.]|nr:GntR family transcriptional regulator [Puia sp.]